jgi:hypothetical protein
MVGAKIDVLVADDEAPDLVIVDDNGVGQARAAVGVGEASLGESEVAERVQDLR